MITESEALSLVLLGRDFIVEQGERGVLRQDSNVPFSPK
jgi:hypothetical protein